MILTPDQLNRRDRYKLMIGAIVPRPIAWVSSMDAAGNLNLAPFSYFTAVCPDPMTLLFCPGWSSVRNRRKDTWINIEQTGEFVINITNEQTKEAMNLSATEFEHGVNEFAWAGVTPAPSQTIRVPRVAEAPVSFECKLQQIVVVRDGPGGGAAVFGEVQCVHVRDDVYDGGRILIEVLQPIGRLAGAGYAHINDLFEMPRVPPPEGDQQAAGSG
ncbi:MAG: flavin reductase family protein [Anaerolineales bacterium]|nr:flavin reductase family protein [Anaerolineales bacterium]